jgi:predicted dehydrogenase
MMDAAIFGMGRWGQTLVKSIQGKSDKLRFVAGITRSPDKYLDFATETGLSLSDDYAAVLADPAIEAVALATPHTLHADHVRQAAAAGKHVFVEKPFALTKASADAAAGACRHANVTLAIGFNRRFRPAFIDMKKIIADGIIGDILHVECHHSGPTFLRTPADSWRATRPENPAGGMAARGVHNLDCMIDLCGDVAAVCAMSERRQVPIDVDDTTSMLFRFASGVTGYLSTIMATGNFWRMQVYGSKGWVEMHGEHALAISDLDAVTDERNWDPTDTLKDELEAFAHAAGGGDPYPVTPAQAVSCVAAFEAIDESAKAGAWMEVS